MKRRRESAPWRKRRAFPRVRIEPQPDKRLGWLEAAMDTRSGRICTKWTYTQGRVRYEISTAVPAVIA